MTYLTMFEKLFENDKCLIINKPNGISVHNAEDESVLEKYKKSGKKYFAVHRIDKETSGILILAKESTFVEELSISLKSATKSYLAICKGRFSNKKGLFNNKISDKSEGRKNPAGVTSNRKEASTFWEVEKETKFFTELLVSIKTGRTHQIRKHCLINKTPIIGDQRYGDTKYNKKIASIYNTNAMALHAYKLVIIIDSNEMEITCDRPDHFITLMEMK